MGVGIEVLIVDWPRVEATKPSAREELLIDAAFGEVYSDDLFEHGWSWPTRPGEDWYARYAFRDTIGSYKPHFWAGHRWEHLRDVVEPQAREALDRFSDALFWHGMADTPGAGSPLPERPCTWDADVLLWCPPDQVPLIAGWWRRARPRLEELREPFDRHAAEPHGWINTFDEFARLLIDWGEVVDTAERRGWGIVGLRC
ncbi:hypothetical protein IGW14_32910 [Streptomyces hygroscopicus subsp. hygroscopicus]|uniref:Uncharacterized protein n=1 Tax=Streptomyces demainii TaxID=588122 RepID=A0ABT9KVF1_9ACTN|nr:MULTISPECIES: hypothetical protein [Streptomyces]MBW8092643.1 hypothetical protein [Streptomyces hygroscopicus subsp. hygroscopicus]MCO8307760.1 hypothetical protein [Streptomyces sp. RKCA744]MDP9612413.1 hypothetical protein [Streptomyces demainii]